jgi:hypothetical protein
LVAALAAALATGRAAKDESVEEAGYRQASAIMDICNDFAPAEA